MDWKTWKQQQVDAIVNEAVENGLDTSGAIFDLFVKGLSRSLDEKYNTKEKKENLPEEVSLADFTGTGTQTRKQVLAQQVHDLLENLEMNVMDLSVTDLTKHKTVDLLGWKEKLEAKQ